MDERYQQDYAELGLANDADWSTARSAYRKLVNRWHPDRYTERPRERAHAETRFIRLARSFDRLRQYYQRHDRLPLERAPVPSVRTLANRRITTEREARHRSTVREAEAFDGRVDSLPHSFRNKRRSNGPSARTWLWGGTAIALLFATLGGVVVIDRNEREAALQAGQEAMRDSAPPAALTPSEQEIRNRTRRGVFVERQDGELGDQLMPDIFK